MKDYIKNHLSPSSIVIISSIFLYSVGFFIHNYYLSTFKIANFDLFKGRYVYSGISFLLVAFFSVLIQSFNSSFSDPRVNFKWKNLFLRLFRFEALVLVTYVLIPGKAAMLLDDSHISIIGIISLSGERLNRVSFAVSISFLFWLMLIIMKKLDQPKEKVEQFEVFTAAVQFIPVTFFFVWGLLFSKLIAEIFWFNFYIFFSILGLQIGSRIGESAKGVPTVESLIFKEKISPKRKGLELRIILAVMIFTGSVGSMGQYAKHIYPILPSNFGGAKPNNIHITCIDGKTIDGELIDASDKEYVIFNNNEEKVTVINKSSVLTSEVTLSSQPQKR